MRRLRQRNFPPLVIMPERTTLAKRALDNGATITKAELTALAQAKLDYARKLLELCHHFGCSSIKEKRQCQFPDKASGVKIH
jgi:hypothetical protein